MGECKGMERKEWTLSHLKSSAGGDALWNIEKAVLLAFLSALYTTHAHSIVTSQRHHAQGSQVCVFIS